jgi:hypothetical protein
MIVPQRTAHSEDIRVLRWWLTNTSVISIQAAGPPDFGDLFGSLGNARINRKYEARDVLPSRLIATDMILRCTKDHASSERCFESG